MMRVSSWTNPLAIFLFCAFTAIASSAQTFTSLLDFDYTNGRYPSSLTRGLDGNFYGLTGTVFRMTPGGTLTTAYTFCSLNLCADGFDPQWLMRGSDGNFYGSTAQGGDSNCNYSSGPGCGTIFRLTEDGVFTVLYTFSSWTTGAGPSGLLQGVDGNLYGVASGGANGYGVVFRLSTKGQFTALYNFCSQSNCSDGSYPTNDTLVQSADGTLYGGTEAGGANGIVSIKTMMTMTTTRIADGIITTHAWSVNSIKPTPRWNSLQEEQHGFVG